MYQFFSVLFMEKKTHIGKTWRISTQISARWYSPGYGSKIFFGILLSFWVLQTNHIDVSHILEKISLGITSGQNVKHLLLARTFVKIFYTYLQVFRDTLDTLN